MPSTTRAERRTSAVHAGTEDKTPAFSCGSHQSNKAASP